MILIKGERPTALHRENYFEAPQFLGLFDPDRAPKLIIKDALQKADQISAMRNEATQEIVTEAAAFASDLTFELNKFDKEHTLQK